MQENNTEKRIIRRMKRTFHGHRIKKNKRRLVTYVRLGNKAISYRAVVYF